jgi:hypothetical protein
MNRIATTSKAVFGLAIFLFVMCSFSSPQTKREDALQSCRDFVQRFYEWYVPKALDIQGGSSSNLALRYKSREFSPELARQLKEDSEAQARNSAEIVGLDFDPFLASQDPSEHFVVTSISQKNGSYLVEVYGTSEGQRREHVVPELVRKNGRWIFVNFHYPDVEREYGKNGDLLTILKNLREDRRNAK